MGASGEVAADERAKCSGYLDTSGEAEKMQNEIQATGHTDHTERKPTAESELGRKLILSQGVQAEGTEGLMRSGRYGEWRRWWR